MIEGSCLCGGVRFAIKSVATQIQLCHATRCRKATGAAYSPEMLALKDQFFWKQGEDLISVYEAPLLNEPPAYRRAFCKKCGSPLPVAIAGTPFMIINPGILDNDPQSRPFRHAFVGQQACWHEIADNLPQFEAQPPVPGQIVSNRTL